jgi:membrane glycosyltransferase
MVIAFHWVLVIFFTALAGFVLIERPPVWIVLACIQC